MSLRATKFAAFAIVVLSLAGCTGEVTTPTASSPTPSVILGGKPSAASVPPQTNSPVSSPSVVTLAQTADAISSAGTAQFASSFGGVEFNASGNGLIVHLVYPSPSLESSLLKAASADPAKVTFSTATRTYASLTELNNVVTRRFASLPAEGIDIRSSGIGPGLKEIISVRGLTAAISNKIHQEFGNDVVVVEAGPEGQLAVMTTLYPGIVATS